MDILRVLDQLQDLVERPKSYGPFTFGYNRDELTMQIAKVRASLPQELKQAAVTVRDSERMIVNAREDATVTLENARKEGQRLVEEAEREAERILEQAHIQQERLLTENEILKLAKAQSEEIRHQADRDSKQMQREADRYALDVLTRIERVIGNAAMAIEKGKKDLESTAGTPVTVPLNPRERSRV